MRIAIAKPSVERVIEKCELELQLNPTRPPKEVVNFWGAFLGLTGSAMEKLLTGKAAN